TEAAPAVGAVGVAASTPQGQKAVEELESLAPDVESVAPEVESLVPSLESTAPEVESVAPQISRGEGCPGCLCFVPGTLVLMADGTTKPIEDVRAGEEVMAGDPETTEPATGHKVIATKTNWAERIVRVEVNDGTNRSIVEATGEHPFWTRSTGWVAARELVS